MKTPTVSEEYKSLFHYTTFCGLKGILGSQTLWASHYRYLNDSEELIHAEKILYSLLLPTMKELISSGVKREPKLRELADNFGGPVALAASESKKFIEILYGTVLGKSDDGELQGPFILAFCADHKDEFINENGLLSQWRGYGKDGGYCIEFESKGLELLIRKEFEKYYHHISIFADVGYGQSLDSSLPKDFKENAEILESLLLSFIENYSTATAEAFIRKAIHPFINVVCRSKHMGFSEEKEVRVISFPGNELFRDGETPEVKARKIKQIHFRSNKGTPVPYIDFFEDCGTLPIKRIIVGPHKDKVLRQEALKRMLKGKGIEVTCSSIPFLGF